MENFLDLLSAYHPIDAQEEASRQKIISLVTNYGKSAFGHDFLPGHVTSSALVVDRALTHALLNHHKKLNMWFQFGGHSDDSPEVRATALREAHEETGLKSLEFYPSLGIFDVDVHSIPEHAGAPAHEHHDVRFLLTADMDELFTVSEESHDIKWVKFEDIESYNHEDTFHRMINKVIVLRKSLP